MTAPRGPIDVIDGHFTLRRGAFDFDVAFSVPDRGVTAVLGESGSGKSTLLRFIAGLEHDPEGRLAVGQEIWQGKLDTVPVHRRNLGVVFQDARLLPHLTVRQNIDFAVRRDDRARKPLETHGGVRTARTAGDILDLADILSLTGAEGLLDRLPHALSGGERRRAAIALALARSPRLLLLDEPLTGLDHQAKQEIMALLETLCDELFVPVFYVTHDPNEIARLADHLLVMRKGRIVQAGDFFDLVNAIDGPLADRDDAEAVLRTTVRGNAEDQLTELVAGETTLRVAGPSPRPAATLRVRIRARDVSLALDEPTRTSILNVIPARVAGVRELGAGQCLVSLDLGASTTILSRITLRSKNALGIRPGLDLFAQVKSVAVLGPDAGDND